VSYTFPTDGVYDIKFSSDWNQITNVNDVTNSLTPPSSPTSLKATQGNNQILLAWTSPYTNGGSPITSYKIYKASTTGSEVLTATVNANTQSFSDKKITNGQTVHYRVTAVNAIGESGFSNEASITAQRANHSK
jgi:predicted phage tail protein